MGIGRRQLVKLGFALAGAHVGTAGQHLASASEQQGEGNPPTGKPAPAADQKSMEDWWLGLEKDEPEASRSLLKLADRRDAAVTFLKGKMKPLTLDAERLDGLLDKLASEDEQVWKPAFEELEYFDPRLAIDLETLMDIVGDAPRRQRMVAVMSGREPATLEGKKVELRKFGGGGHNFLSTPGGSWWAEFDISLINAKSWSQTHKKWTRAVRAIALLEHLGTPNAIAILKDMAGGHHLAQPTREAAKAIERMDGKGR
jgi:hypothetical protein